MPTLKSGAIILGAYATKIRKTLFAQLKDRVKSGEISSQEIARAAGELNKTLYTLFVEKLRLEKGDVVRVTIDYEIENQRISWKWDTIKIECFKRISEDEISKHLKTVLKGEEVGYSMRKIRETRIGDILFEVLENGKQVGIMVVTPLNGEAVIRGAIKQVGIIPRLRMKIEGEIEDFLPSRINEILKHANKAEEREIEKLIEEISSL
jgi:hypothetical protein